MAGESNVDIGGGDRPTRRENRERRMAPKRRPQETPPGPGTLGPGSPAQRRAGRLLGVLLTWTLGPGCDAELEPAFQDGPRFELLVDQIPGPVWALVEGSNGVPLAFGGPDDGPPFAAQLRNDVLEAISHPAEPGPARAARRQGSDIWVAGGGFLWRGTSSDFRAVDTPVPDPQLTDVAPLRGGGVVAVGADVVLRARTATSVETLELEEGARAVWSDETEALWIGSPEGLHRLDSSGQRQDVGVPDRTEVRSLEGEGAALYAAGASDSGYIARIEEDSVQDLSIGSMPALHVVRAAPNGYIWVGGGGGFLARFDGQRWQAFQLPNVDGPVLALLRESENRWLLGGRRASPNVGWLGRFWPSQEDAF